MGKCKHKVSHILADLKQISPQKASSWSRIKYHEIAILYVFPALHRIKLFTL